MIQSAEEFVALVDASSRAAITDAAFDPNLWSDVLSKFPDYRAAVIWNKTVPASVLDLLSTDIDINIRRIVANQPRIELATFLRLANDESEDVRGALAHNPRLPDAVREAMSLDHSEWVQKQLKLSSQNSNRPKRTSP